MKAIINGHEIKSLVGFTHGIREGDRRSEVVIDIERFKANSQEDEEYLFHLRKKREEIEMVFTDGGKVLNLIGGEMKDYSSLPDKPYEIYFVFLFSDFTMSMEADQ